MKKLIVISLLMGLSIPVFAKAATEKLADCFGAGSFLSCDTCCTGWCQAHNDCAGNFTASCYTECARSYPQSKTAIDQVVASDKTPVSAKRASAAVYAR